MPTIAENLKLINSQLPSENFTLIAVSKTKPVQAVQEAYDAGHRHFGENKVQELTQKHEVLPKDILWHLIGHLQRNKVKYIAPFVHLIHSVDSEKLLQEIDKEAAKCHRIVNCLLQVHIAEEETKFGFDKTELFEFLDSSALSKYPNVRVVGLMGMATFTDNTLQIRREFASLREMYQVINANDELLSSNNLSPLTVLSMGMSGDYRIAIEEGSNMVRIGTAIFGERNYKV